MLNDKKFSMNVICVIVLLLRMDVLIEFCPAFTLHVYTCMKQIEIDEGHCPDNEFCTKTININYQIKLLNVFILVFDK